MTAATMSVYQPQTGMNDTEMVMSWLLTKTSEHTRRAYKKSIADFTEWVAGNLGKRLADVEPCDVEHYQTWLKEVKASKPSSVSRHVNAISSFYKHACRYDGALKHVRNPCEDITRVKPASVHTKAVDSKDIKKLVEAARESEFFPRDLALVLILITSGLRASEISGANRSDLETSDGLCVLTIRGKGGKVRKVVLPYEVCQLVYSSEMSESTSLVVSGDDLEPLIPCNNGGRLNRDKIRGILERLCRHAEIARISPHQLRASCATEALESGAALYDVQSLLGHADPRTTEGYISRKNELKKLNAISAGLAAKFS